MINNIPPNITSKVGKNLYTISNHPICIIKQKIYDFFDGKREIFEDLNPYVDIQMNFDDLLISEDHPSRSKSDTFYFNERTVLRTHTSAHQNNLLVKGHRRFLVTGDVYRKDEIDSSHYPVFHQTEGVCIFENGEDALEELKTTLGGLVEHLFPGCEYRFNDDTFPFTDPSCEVEVKFNNKWLEVLGAGVVHQDIMYNCGIGDKTGWAFGLGLERLAMVLFQIPDIRYFWTIDDRFLKQFDNGGEGVIFIPYSKYPPCKRDISFWLSDKFNYNDFCEIIRELGRDLVEEIELVDEFKRKSDNKESKCYRITYRSNDRSLTNEEIDSIQNNARKQIEENLQVEIR